MAQAIWILNYGAGNVRSLVNAVERMLPGVEVHWVETPADIEAAPVLLFPGVGDFGYAARRLREQGFEQALRAYIASGRPFMGICVGMQVLFEGSQEAPADAGLGILPGQLRRFTDADKSVPCIGWNSATPPPEHRSDIYGLTRHAKYYYVHSYHVPLAEIPGYQVASARYGAEEYVGAVARHNFLATQFHPEKSGAAGLHVIERFCRGIYEVPLSAHAALPVPGDSCNGTGLTHRVIACLDVRSNDMGDLVVTKGDQYDVREKDGRGDVRNLGKPVALASRYCAEGADEVTFLNITSFRALPLHDAPMLGVLREAARTVYVPMTVGGGIRDVVDPDGTRYSAREVAALYFDSGADKVSIGSDAVLAAEEYYARGQVLTGDTAIETISAAYGRQAVVVSVDPRRIYVSSPEACPEHHVIPVSRPGPAGERYAWYQCTIKGGREGRDLDVHQLVLAVEAMGAGEILLNSMDQDGTKSGYDLDLTRDVKQAIRIPVIASSGAGSVEHFAQVFRETGCEAALAAGIFHHNTCSIASVKEHLTEEGLLVRQDL